MYFYKSFVFFILFLFLGCVPESINLDSNIPDASFRLELKKLFPQFFNGEYLDIESEGVKNIKKLELFVSEKVKSIEGIEFFTGLDTLRIGGYPFLSELDLSKNRKLSVVEVKNTGIEQIIFENSRIKVLDCSLNEDLSQLDLSSLTSLERLICSRNQLERLTMNNLEKLEYIDCRFNGIKELNIPKSSNLTTLLCDNNKITRIDIRTSRNLKDLNISSSTLDNPLNRLYINESNKQLSSVVELQKLRNDNLIIFLFKGEVEVCSDYNAIDDICTNGLPPKEQE